MNINPLKQRTILVIVLLILSVMGLYAQVGSHDFINFDDPEYVYANPYVQKGLSLASISWAFTATHAANWHPLTWLSHMLVVQVFALNPVAHHLANVFLHAANTALLFCILASISGGIWQSAVVAAFFALHPLHVESVAWVAELKDVLSTFFGLLTICFHVWYVKAPNLRRSALMVACFALALMAKPMLVTLPVLLLLLDYWPLRRLGTVQGTVPVEGTDRRPFGVLIREKVPLLALVAVSCVMTIHAQQQGKAIRSLADSPLPARMSNALLAYLGYLGKTFWPVDLGVLYPFPTVIPLWKPVAAGIILIAITLPVVLCRKRHPYLFVGWFWYLFALVPVIGLVRVGQQAMADRYTYLPSVGIFIMLVFGADKLTAGWRHRRIALLSVTVAALSACTLISWRQLYYWQNNETLYGHTLDVTRDNYTIHNNLGFALDAAGKPDAALQHYDEAIRIAPWYAKSHLNRGIALRKKGLVDEAMGSVREAITLNPDCAPAHIELGLGMLLSGMPDKAIDHFQAALQLDPTLADGHYNMGLAYAKQGKSQQALEQFMAALLLKPDDFDCHYYLGVELARLGRYDDAIAHFTATMSLGPDPEMEQMARQGLNRTLQLKARQ